MKVDNFFIFFFHLLAERNTFKDSENFASKVVKCVGQVVGLVVASDQHTAQRAARLVKVHYKDLGEPIITIEVCSTSADRKLLVHTHKILLFSFFSFSHGARSAPW